MTVESQFFLLLILGIFWGGNCNVYQWGLTFNETVVRAACLLECSDQPCMTNCTGNPKKIIQLDEEAKADARLVCRDLLYVVLAHNPGLFVFELPFNLSPWNPSPVVSNSTEETAFTMWPLDFGQFHVYRILSNGISMPDTMEFMNVYPYESSTALKVFTGILVIDVRRQPMGVTNIKIGSIVVDTKFFSSWSVEISFTPSVDRPCFYEVRCQQDDGPYNQMIPLQNSQVFSVTFEYLPFGVNFTVTVTALSHELKRRFLNGAKGTIATFSTPRCLNHSEAQGCSPKAVNGLNATTTHKMGNIFDVHVTWDDPDDDDYPEKYSIDINPNNGRIDDRVSIEVDRSARNVVFPNVTILDQYEVSIRAKNLIGKGPIISKRFTTGLKRSSVPVAVEGLNATVDPKVGNTFDICVSWDRPEMIPDFYIVKITSNGSQTNYTVSHIIAGSANETIFSDVKISEEFDVRMRAWSSAGGGPEISRRFKKPETYNGRIDTPENDLKPIYLAGTISVIVIGIGIAVYGYFRFRKRPLNQTVPVDEFEINPERLTITQVLGTGNFGVVKLGSLRDNLGNVINVAVKMLQDDSNKNDRRNFLHEIEIMKTIDEHPNILCLLGCNTTSPYPFLVVEYCSRGDLQSFLRKSLVEASTTFEGEKKKPITHNIRSPRRKEILPANSRSLSMFRSGDDYIQVTSPPEVQDTNSEPEVVTVMDMLNFGRQIATGMEFLSSSRVVHRDLATRNVLVCHDRTVKISDFGLSRDIYRQNVYKKWGNGQMPLKWMAIESLTHQVYTTCSDVWSFGVLLWEIVTLGGEPYPGVPTLQILRQLQLGYRMERPENCSMPLYKVMRSCWQTRPKDRPTFTVLRQELDKLISAATKNEYFDLNDVSEGTPPQVDDSQISVSRPSSCHLQVAIVNDLEPPINTEVPEGMTDELEMD